MKDDTPTDLNARIAQRVGQLRAAQGFSLDQLAKRSQVSRSMISLIERGESSPTAVVLEKLATGLSVTLASLFDAPECGKSPIQRRKDQAVWKDPHSGYLRRNVSPGISAQGIGSPIQIVQVRFAPKARVAFETSAHQPLVHQQIWMLQGRMQVTLGKDTHTLETGDCFAMVLDRPLSYYNPTGRTAHYAVVLCSAAKF